MCLQVYYDNYLHKNLICEKKKRTVCETFNNNFFFNLIQL